MLEKFKKSIEFADEFDNYLTRELPSLFEKAVGTENEIEFESEEKLVDINVDGVRISEDDIISRIYEILLENKINEALMEAKYLISKNTNVEGYS